MKYTYLSYGFLFLTLFYEKIHFDFLECYNVLNCHFFIFQKKRKYCVNPKVCNLWHNSSVRYMRTCQECPPNYPWTGNTGISNSLADEIKNQSSRYASFREFYASQPPCGRAASEPSVLNPRSNKTNKQLVQSMFPTYCGCAPIMEQPSRFFLYFPTQTLTVFSRYFKKNEQLLSNVNGFEKCESFSQYIVVAIFIYLLFIFALRLL